MSFAEDFDHFIPDDEWMSGGYSYPRKYRSSRSYTDYSAKTEMFYEEKVIETEKAILFRFERGKAWIPKSKLILHVPERLRICIPFWLYRDLNYIREDA